MDVGHVKKDNLNRKYSITPVLIWTIIVAIGFGFNVYDHHQDILSEAATEARTFYQLNLAYRSWVAKVGGVYAPIDKVEPNPYLKVPNRDITTKDNKHLTLVNPAYMTRLVFDIVQTQIKLPVKNKLTSLKYLNPLNSPSEWERQNLLAFEKGKAEAIEIATIDNQPYLRLMKPFITEESCLKCHGTQGYKVGDVRGAISIFVPLQAYYTPEILTVIKMGVIYCSLWLIVCIGLVRFSVKRYQQEKQIIDSEGKFRMLAETTQDWDYLLGEDKSIRFMATSSEPLTGYPPEAYLKDPQLLNNIIHPEDREAWQNHITSLRDIPHHQMEFRIIDKEGKVKWISHICSPVYQDGVFIGRHSSNRDITSRKIYEQEQKMAEERLRHSEDSLLQAQRIAHIGSWDWNLKTRDVVCSAEMYKIFGRSPETFKITYENFLGVLHPQDKQTVIDALNDAIAKKKPYDIEYRLIMPDGTVKVAHAQGEVQCDTDGTPISLAGTLQDITEYRKLENQLFQSQKMEAVGQLAGGVAHDFNNMLTAIIGYGNLIKMKLEPSSPLKPHMEQLLEAAKKSANLTKQLLAFSRKQVIEPRETDINGLIGGMQKMLLRLIGEDIELKSQLTGKSCYAMVDPGQIEQVIMNLCTNARDAMPKGGVLSISTSIVSMDQHNTLTHEVEKPGKYILISVSDNGTGMDEATRQKIFEPFFTTKEIGKGTGLGLSIAYGIIKQHHGNITVYSELGRGTTFKIYLPWIKEPRQEERESVDEVPIGGTETILLGEDNEDARKFTMQILSEFGYSVIAAVDGEEAIKLFRENQEKIQLVLLDVVMPKKSGKDAYDEIRKMKPNVKVLFTSGYTADIVSKQGIIEAGIEFVSKPATPMVLLTKIRKVLDRK